jgi:DNA-binding transcriptional regulator YhcF (GntR family)
MQQDVAFLEQQCTIKTKGENVMFVNPELHGKKRQEQLDENVRKATREHEEAKKNSGFTQVSPKGWERVRELLTDKQGVAALRLYSFLAEHIDPSCGAVVADQQFLADKMGVNRSTIIRWLNYLESKNALVRIPVAGKVCAYALDPHEVWKGYNTSKDYSAFVTKTLVNNDGDIKRRIMSMFSSNE